MVNHTLWRNFLTLLLIAVAFCSGAAQAANVLQNPNIVLSSAASTESVILTVSPAALWTATSNDSWLGLASGSEGGNASELVVFTVAENTGATRTGTITIAGQTLTVTQASSAFSFASQPVTLGNTPLPFGTVPAGLALDAAGDLYFSQRGSGPLSKWTAATNTFSAVTNTFAIADGRGVALDSAGDVFIAQNFAIKKYTVATNTIDDLIADFGLSQCVGTAFDRAGDLWFTVGNGRLKKRVTSTGVISDISTASTNLPGGVAIDALDNVYVAAYNGATGFFDLLKYPAGSTPPIIVAEQIDSSFTARPMVAVDGSGNVYITNADGILVKKWSAATGAVSAIPMSGLSAPISIASDKAGNLFVGMASFSPTPKIAALPRVLVPNETFALPATAGTATIPDTIPSSVNRVAPFQWSSDSAWLTATSPGGVLTYTWEASSAARFAYLSVAGQRIYVQQGTPTAPSLGSPSAVPLASTATLNGDITADGGAPITARGFVFSATTVNNNPEMGGTGVIQLDDTTLSTGVLINFAFSLTPDTSYTFKAFATNMVGTTYSSVASFRTEPLDTGFFASSNFPVKTTANDPNGMLIVGAEGGEEFVPNALTRFDITSFQDSTWSYRFIGSIESILPLENGQTLVAGSFPSITPQAEPTDIERNNIALLNNDGTVAAGFAPNVNGLITAMALQGDGSILIGGSFTAVNGVSRNRLARLYSDGRLDLTFNPNLNGTVRTLAVQQNGGILVGGDFTLVGSTVRNRIARLTAAGAVDAAFVASADSSVHCIRLLPSGKMLVGGGFTRINSIARTRLALLNANGTLDSIVPPAVNDTVLSIGLQTDGGVIIGGAFTEVGGATRNRVAKFNSATGTLDSVYAPNIPTTVNSITIQSNGGVVIGGAFSNIPGTSSTNIARLLNTHASETLSLVSSRRIEILRGGSAGEVDEMFFDVSTDTGTTWTPLGKGSRIAGGWGITTATDLPATGELRMRGTGGSGHGNGSRTWSLFEPAAYTLGEQEIAVTPAGNLGPVGIKVPFVTTFTITNSGGLPLTGITAAITGPDAAMFKIVVPPASTVFANQSTTVSVQAALTSPGAKSATLTITSNDADESATIIALSAAGVPANIPKATTGAASGITHAAATLNGTVDGKGDSKAVFFDYGITNLFGQTAAAGSFSGEQDVTAALTGLKPHTVYFYRVRAESALGSKTGAPKKFTTANRQPAAANDVAIGLKNGITPIDVLANDSDPDGDRLTLTGKPVVTPSTAGKAAYISNQLVFAAVPGFTGIATINYIVSDGFKGTATAAVTINLGNVSIDLANKNVVSGGGTYPVEITANGIWSVTGKLPWVSVSQTQGKGDTIVFITVQPNVSAATRSGQLNFSGLTHDISQAAALVPGITVPATGLDTIVGEPYRLAIPNNGQSAQYKAAGKLPPGLKLDANTGIISGIPTTAGNYPVVISAKNAAGPAANTVSITINVQSMPEQVRGNFQGFVDRSSGTRFGKEPNLGARFEMTVSANGIVTGSIIEGTTKKSFKKVQMVSTFGSPSAHQFAAPLVGTSLFMDIVFDTAMNTASGALRDVNGLQAPAFITAWRTGKTTTYKAAHTFRIGNDDTANGPQGFGFGTATLDGPKGIVTIIGKLQEGSAISGKASLGQNGEILVYQSLHDKRGSCFGKLTLTEVNAPDDNTITGSLTWQKPASLPKSKDTVHASGFGPLALTVEGSAYLSPASGGFLMPSGSTLTFTDGGLAALFTQDIDVASLGGTKNLFIPVEPSTNSVAIPKTIDITKGGFEGTFSIGSSSAVWFGQIVRIGTTTEGYGYFLLPDGTPANAKLGGKVVLVAP